MKSDTPERADSIVSRNTVVEGEMHGGENLTIEGTVKGNLKIDGRVIVGESGVVEADIEAKSVIVRGRVTGDVTASNELEVHPSGELYGKIRARLIHIKEGAVFEGRSQMIRPPEAETGPVPMAASATDAGSGAPPAGEPGVVGG
jgi:cytoskeletal protein CcmA (bactofilin family)